MEGSRPQGTARLAEEAGIMLVPGEFFDMKGQFLRVGCGRANFPEVLARFETWLEACG